ncbi:DUF427 domain-containing protein [Nocardioides ochotonae]|uniref:DUF427 domain-containing protein n=1 Tax=Nocardioides ochotonae TaxID=2685869 RepID=UPI001CD405D2|nr:DUF427 domain-containing protein [Nocardioides ochotonae]
MRAHLDDQVVVDSRPSRDAPRHPSSFFGPHGPVAQWYDVALGERTVPHAAWVRDDPALADLLILSWQPGVLDRWTEEDETVLMHPRDPHKRVEALASSRHVVVELDGVRLAESRRPVLLLETGLPTRYYLPREDVALELLEASDTRSTCPYKGTTDDYWSLPGHPEADDIAWSYADPLPAVAKIAGRVAFYDERVDLTVDGVIHQRPTTPFS